ncbi:hypothetical protein YH65_03965 [Sulfurovum lithotrophicum]|uniref:DUF4412 domain-containing protein n=1 Tax=Sulfurovum lithotrophicum TaxID=206403 RepID=A0A7U4RQG1_9BACT|nr:hypothetical protein [Sulfurovum lithotrophicum]AKF24636.1 hypothetical protein YH65_03965 [Sulfurovum lithotrophicum]
MKKLLFLSLSFIFISTQVLYAKTKRYKVESGMVTYKITGSGNIMGMKHETHGHKTLYFEDYGNVQVQETEETTTTMGRTETRHELVKIQDGMVYSVDYKQKRITKQDMSELMNGKDMSKMGKEMLKNMGGKKVGEGEVLGLPCEVWEVMGSKIWMHKGVTLKIESNIMGMTHKEEATEAKFGVSIPSDKLKLPDYPIQSLEEMMQHQMSTPGRGGHQPSPEEIKQMQEMMKNMFKSK